MTYSFRTCNFSFSGNYVCFTTDKQMGYPCDIYIVDARNFNKDEPVFKVSIPDKGPKVRVVDSVNLIQFGCVKKI